MSELSNKALCDQFGIAVYRVSEIYDTDEVGNFIPDEDRQKFCVTTPAGVFDTLVKSVPLSASISDAEMLAVEHLKLRKL